MGYATRYNMNWAAQDEYVEPPSCSHKPPKKSRFCPECGGPVGKIPLDDIVAAYIANNESMEYAMDSGGDSKDACKWYDHEDDMRKMSSSIQHVLFCLHGEGEESGDIWDAYFLNGKAQKHKAEIRIAPMDPKAWT